MVRAVRDAPLNHEAVDVLRARAPEIAARIDGEVEHRASSPVPPMQSNAPTWVTASSADAGFSVKRVVSVWAYITALATR